MEVECHKFMPVSRPTALSERVQYLVLDSIEREVPLEFFFYSTAEAAQVLGTPGSKERRAATNYRCNRQRTRKKWPRHYVKKCLELGVQIREGDIFLNKIEQELKLNMSPVKNNKDPDYSEDQSLLDGVMKKEQRKAKPPPPPTSSAMKLRSPAATKSSNLHPAQKENELGKQIVLKMPGGILFCILWIDAKLNAKTLKFMVSHDGMSLIQQKKMPLPKSASKLLRVYKWGGQKKHTTVETLQDELARLTHGLSKEDMWEPTEVLHFSEAMLPEFYNDRGQPHGTIQYDVDSAGRQFILFHLKTVAAHQKAPEAGIFSNSHGRSRKKRYSMDVDTDDDDDDDDEDDDDEEEDEQDDEQDDEEEYFSPRNDSKRPSGFDDDKLKNFASQMLAEVHEMMVQSQTNQRAETEQLLQQYTGQQMFAQGPPVPDGHPSS